MYIHILVHLSMVVWCCVDTHTYLYDFSCISHTDRVIYIYIYIHIQYKYIDIY